MAYNTNLTHETNTAVAEMHLARFLISEADNRGLTHGEKHFMMQTALYFLHKAETRVSGGQVSVIERHQVETLPVEDIPF